MTDLMPDSLRILGIDPGLNITGYGVLETVDAEDAVGGVGHGAK